MAVLKHKALDHAIGTAATPAKAMKPGTKAWAKRVTATKIAPLLGVSAYTSFYEIWHLLAGNLPAKATTYAMRRGTHLERGVAELWAEEHGWDIATTGAWQSTAYGWLYCTPDRLGKPPGDDGQVHCVEVKTTSTWNGWGPDGSSWIPEDYSWQTLGQSLVTGLPVVVVVLGPGLELRTYWPQWGEFQVQQLIERVPALLDTLPGGVNEQPPLPDAGDLGVYLATTPVARGLQVELAPTSMLAIKYERARLQQQEVEQELEELRSELALELGSAERLTWRGITLASRTAAGALLTAPPDRLRKAF